MLLATPLGWYSLYNTPHQEHAGASPLEQQQTLNQFLADVERRAYRMAKIASGHSEDALDIVQDSMLTLAHKYGHKPSSEWKPLFWRILQSKINDWHRRNTVRNRFRSWLKPFTDDDDPADPIQQAADPHGRDPQAMLENTDTGTALDFALKQLPLRQQQAFLLRNWEGLNVAETAHAMGCSEGSVKTHYSRAVHFLRNQLEEHWR